MHKCELTNQQLQAEIATNANMATNERMSPTTRQNTRHLADALQELLDRRKDAESEFRVTEASFAYSHACSVIAETTAVDVEAGIDAYDLSQVHQNFVSGVRDAVAYLNQRGLIVLGDRPNVIHVQDEGEDRAEGPLDPCPEVMR